MHELLFQAGVKGSEESSFLLIVYYHTLSIYVLIFPREENWRLTALFAPAEMNWAS